MKRIFRSLIRFGRRPLAEKWLFLQAYLGLGCARLAVQSVPFRRLAASFGKARSEVVHELDERQLAEARRVSWAVKRAAGLTPWKSNCLPQAMTAKRLLAKRGVPSTLYLGASFKEACTIGEARALQAHAWLRCGPWFITGGKEHAQFASLVSFAED